MIYLKVLGITPQVSDLSNYATEVDLELVSASVMM